MIVRRMVHALGYRYRLHVMTLPGKPDIVLPRLRRIIDVRGCFWHMHSCIDRVPKSRHAYWLPKLQRNRKRDEWARRRLQRLGWRVLIVWECEAKDADRLRARLKRFLN